MKILLIEDDEILADRLVQSLTQRQYIVDAIADGQVGLEYAQSTSYDLIVSDVGLPSMDGVTLCSRLRQEGSSIPILLMTAKDVPDERIRGLDAGADDYLTKPLNLEEMHARVRALLRRKEVAPETVLQAGALQLDPASCQVTYGDKYLKLTPKEYSLLELFMSSPNRVFSRSRLIEHLWTFDDPPLEDSVKAHIKGLRRKLKEAGAVDWIDNVYGIGYRFTPQIVPESPEMAVAEAASTFTASAVKGAPTVEAAPSPPVEEIFKESMAGLWEKYQGLMSDRVDALTQAAEAIKANTFTPDILATAATAAHKLAGVLGMFELDRGSDLARELEARLQTSQAEALSSVPALVAQLVEMMQLAPSEPASSSKAEASYTLLISPDTALVEDLTALGQATQSPWQSVSTIADAESLIQRLSPDLVIIDIAAASLWTATIDFIQQLAASTPAIPTIALTTTDSLIDRVAIAQAGLQKLLIKPVTPEQVWGVAAQVRQHSQQLAAQILVVDDDPLIHKALRPLLEPWGLGVMGLETPDRFWEVLAAAQPDLLILDVKMPSFSGIELCQAVRTDPDWQNLPILFLTSHRDADTVQAVFRVGADDFIAKPIVGPELLTRILNRLERNRLLQTRSHQDAVTGLPNYPHSQQVLSQLFEAAQLNSTPATLALIRIGAFEAIAHHHGQEAKHTILQTWGQCFQALASATGPMGYWGSGEFVIGLPTAQAEAQETLAPLLQMLRRQIITLPSGERLQPAVENAFAEYSTDCQTLQALYRGAIVL